MLKSLLIRGLLGSPPFPGLSRFGPPGPGFGGLRQRHRAARRRRGGLFPPPVPPPVPGGPGFDRPGFAPGAFGPEGPPGAYPGIEHDPGAQGYPGPSFDRAAESVPFSGGHPDVVDERGMPEDPGVMGSPHEPGSGRNL